MTKTTVDKVWETVQIARNTKRPTAQTLISRLFTEFVELHGDRLYGDDASFIGGIGLLGDVPTTVIGQEKGITTNEKIKRNFGMGHPEGYHKALRLMKQAEKFHRPILFIIDTPGAYPGVGAEERGQAAAIALNLAEMIALKTPMISVVLGEGGSGRARHRCERRGLDVRKRNILDPLPGRIRFDSIQGRIACPAGGRRHETHGGGFACLRDHRAHHPRGRGRTP